jgi:hypothetical protein
MTVSAALRWRKPMFVFSGSIFIEEIAPVQQWLVEAGRRDTLILITGSDAITLSGA